MCACGDNSENVVLVDGFKNGGIERKKNMKTCDRNPSKSLLGETGWFASEQRPINPPIRQGGTSCSS